MADGAGVEGAVWGTLIEDAGRGGTGGGEEEDGAGGIHC